VPGTFEVLAEPNRRRILDLLAEAERPVGELVGALGVSQPAVSKHLRVLREAGLVEVRGDAQRRLYRVRAEPLRDLDEWLRPYRRMWASSLDALDSHLATIAGDRADGDAATGRDRAESPVMTDDDREENGT
jgi:DNA-binding transcriptional ArsR family regulator